MKRKTFKNILKLALLITVIFVGGYMIFTWLQVLGG
jgi:hypothetical protein